MEITQQSRHRPFRFTACANLLIVVQHSSLRTGCLPPSSCSPGLEWNKDSLHDRTGGVGLLSLFSFVVILLSKTELLCLTNSPERSPTPQFQCNPHISILIEAWKHPWESFSFRAQLLSCTSPCCLPGSVDSSIVLRLTVTLIFIRGLSSVLA